MNLDFDLHVHTFHSPCGESEMLPAEIVRTAAERGITRLGMTDHFYPFTDPAIFDEIRSAVKDARSVADGSLEVLFGCEAEIMAPGRTAGSPRLAERLDFVMAGATHFQNAGITDLPRDAKDDRAIAEHYLKMFEYAVSLPWMDVVAHPFFVMPGVCPVEALDTLSDGELLSGLEMAKENKVAMEISRRVFWPGQIGFSMRFYRLCKKVGLKFTVGSDAHRLEDVGDVHILEPVFTELGLTEKDFWLPRSKTR